MLAEQRFSSSVMTNGVTPGAVAGMAALAETAPPGEPLPTEPHERHRQPQKYLAQLDETAQMLAGLRTADAAFQGAMAGAGLMESYLAECNARYIAAEQAVEARHLAMVEALKATETLADANFQARAAYSVFRQVARTVVTSSSGQMALDLDEATPSERGTFLRTAAAALTTAQGEPYAALLQTATFGPERVAATLATLDVLADAASVQAAVQHHAKLATQRRDEAMGELATVARQIKVEVKTLLRRNPQLTPPVGFAR